MEVKFVRRLERGTKTYKRKLNLKYFDSGRIGHYTYKCMYKEDYKWFDDDDEKKSRHKMYDTRKRIDDR